MPIRYPGLADGRNEDRRGGENDGQLDRLFRLGRGLATATFSAGDAYAEPSADRNMSLLLAGDHYTQAVAKPFGTVQGAPGTRQVAPIEITGDGITITGMHFDAGPQNLTTAQVTVGATARVTFMGCRFTRPTGLGGDFVAVTAGGRASFVGCTFDGAVAAGNVVNNAGAAANVGIVGGTNATTRTHVNCTIIFEV